MADKLSVFLIVLVFCYSTEAADPTCLIQGLCGTNENGNVPCTVKKEPHKFEDSSDVLNILKDECPELFPKGSSGIPDVCCSPNDVLLMQKTLKTINKFLEICPSCAKNINEFLCHFHCAPNQAGFLEITKTSASVNGSAIDSLSYYVDKKSLEDLFQTCSQVPALKAVVRMGGCEKDCENAAEFARVMGMRKVKSPIQLDIKPIDRGASVQVNGRKGSPVEFMIQRCTDTKSCSDVCL